MSRNPLQDKTNARLSAVQALYQMETSGLGVESVILEFRTHRFGTAIDGAEFGEVDEEFFSSLLRGVVSGQDRIDRAIETRLASGWKLSRLDATARAILRAAVFELTHFAATPARVIINEYVDIAKCFFDGDEPSFINAALDSVARDLRDEEFSGATAGGR
ncbi:MAG: transcription antitermination factor NusB [Parvularculaceae bacterium]